MLRPAWFLSPRPTFFKKKQTCKKIDVNFLQVLKTRKYKLLVTKTNSTLYI